MIGNLLITAPTFRATVEFVGDVVSKVPPSLRWMRGWSRCHVVLEARHRGWRVEAANPAC